MKHHCHAAGCARLVPAEMLMCRRHWFSVPLRLRNRVWATYRHGQTRDKHPSLEWCRAADEAVAHVAEREGKPVPLTFAQAFYPAEVAS